MKYVLGFMYDLNGRVLLIEKRRPAWQAGLLNGVGGKIEAGEEPVMAMVREFAEETGLETSTEDWRHLATLAFGEDIGADRLRMAVFACRSDRLDDAKSMTDEPIRIVNLLQIPPHVVPNLHFLIGLSMERLGGPVFIDDRGSPQDPSDLHRIVSAAR